MATKRYEGSKADMRKDTAGAKKTGMTMKAFEKSSMDTKTDRAGQKAMDKGAKRK